uniref:Cyclic nucleotide-binding domain-containing protein n=1 Tax=Setaria digitata TaxID=48799 RepID=A0A915PEP8_9BILA
MENSKKNLNDEIWKSKRKTKRKRLRRILLNDEFPSETDQDNSIPNKDESAIRRPFSSPINFQNQSSSSSSPNKLLYAKSFEHLDPEQLMELTNSQNYWIHSRSHDGILNNCFKRRERENAPNNSAIKFIPVNDSFQEKCKLLRSNKICGIDEGKNWSLPKVSSDNVNENHKKPKQLTTIEPVAFDGLPPKNPESEDATSIYRRKWRYFWKEWVLDTKDEFYYYWLSMVSFAYAYNLIVVVARSVFSDLGSGYYWIAWIIADFVMDAIYVFDMFVRSRTGFLEQGLLVRDISRITKLYLKSLQFKMDIISVLPLDLILSLILFRPVPFIRFNRIIRYPRFSDFVDRTETRSSMPNAFRVFCVIANIVVIIHWNACIYFFISQMIGLGTDGWVYGTLNKQSLPDGVKDTLARRYIYSFYWSTLILTTIGEVPSPKRNVEFVFVIMDLMCGVLIFATIVGNVGSVISNMSATRTEFQNKMDGIKQYMKLRKVSKELETRVMKWFDYLWEHKQSLSDQRVLKVLPDKLQTEIAMQVHFETLRRVRIFQDCEAGLLAELVLKLQQQIFSPGDYICRKGDIGREMYIVKRGKLQVVADDGIKVFATLQEGSVFGELSILNIAGSKNGNRRTANVRSVGYTDLFALNKNDLWTALKEYPDARKLLIAKGREILRKDGLLDEDAPEEQMTAEEMAKSLQNTLKIMQTKMARFVAEFTSVKSKLLARIEYLETQLAKYQTDENLASSSRAC